MGLALERDRARLQPDCIDSHSCQVLLEWWSKARGRGIQARDDDAKTLGPEVYRNSGGWRGRGRKPGCCRVVVEWNACMPGAMGRCDAAEDDHGVGKSGHRASQGSLCRGRQHRMTSMTRGSRIVSPVATRIPTRAGRPGQPRPGAPLCTPFTPLRGYAATALDPAKTCCPSRCPSCLPIRRPVCPVCPCRLANPRPASIKVT